MTHRPAVEVRITRPVTDPGDTADVVTFDRLTGDETRTGLVLRKATGRRAYSLVRDGHTVPGAEALTKGDAIELARRLAV